MATYQARRYHAVDPIVRHTLTRQTLPLVWNDIDPDAYADTARVRTLFREADDFGMRAGVSFPVQGQNGEHALLSLATRDDHFQARGRIREAMPFAQLLAAYVHEAARNVFAEGDVAVQRPQLTPREQECLLWAAEGKTSWDISMILGTAERTVLFHLQNAADKLDVTNRAQAVARAISQGYITPSLS